MNKYKSSYLILLSVAFLDSFGIALAFPLLSLISFDSQYSFLPPETSLAMRSMWMSIFITLSAGLQFFFSPLLGTLSDQKGRVPVIKFGLFCGILGYFFSLWAVHQSSSLLFIIYRVLFGISAATFSVVQAALSDLSESPDEKQKFFEGLSIASGVGLTVGPSISGKLISLTWHSSFFRLGAPFALALGLSLFALWTVCTSLKNDHTQQNSTKTFHWKKQGQELLSICTEKKLRPQLWALFLFCFGWDFFIEFGPLFFMRIHLFSPNDVGNFYAYMGFSYATILALCVRKFAKYCQAKNLLLIAMLGGGIMLGGLLLVQRYSSLLLYTPFLAFWIALFFPSATRYISDSATREEQGKVLGRFGAIQALALVLSPLILGPFAGSTPTLIVLLSSLVMTAGAVLFGVFSYSPKPKQIEPL